MSDNNKSVLFRLVKYLLIIMYLGNILIFSVIIIFGVVHISATNEKVRVFKEQVKDFNDSYNQDAHRNYGIFLVIFASLIILVTIYFIYAAVIESLVQNLVIAGLFIFTTVIQLIFDYKRIDGIIYSVWSDIIVLVYAYLIDRNNRTTNRRVSYLGNTQLIGEQSAFEFDVL